MYPLQPVQTGNWPAAGYPALGLDRLFEVSDLRDTEMYLPSTELCPANVT